MFLYFDPDLYFSEVLVKAIDLNRVTRISKSLNFDGCIISDSSIFCTATIVGKAIV